MSLLIVTAEPIAGNADDGISPGGKAALVIILLVVPVCACAAIGGWIGFRKYKKQPIIPDAIKAKLPSKLQSIV